MPQLSCASITDRLFLYFTNWMQWYILEIIPSVLSLLPCVCPAVNSCALNTWTDLRKWRESFGPVYSHWGFNLRLTADFICCYSEWQWRSNTLSLWPVLIDFPAALTSGSHLPPQTSQQSRVTVKTWAGPRQFYTVWEVFDQMSNLDESYLGCLGDFEN